MKEKQQLGTYTSAELALEGSVVTSPFDSVERMRLVLDWRVSVKQDLT